LLNPDFTTTQHFYIIPLFVGVKLGLWNEIENTPEPDAELKYPRIIWNYARGMAALARNKPKKAEKHLDAMNTIMQDTSLRNMTIWGVNYLIDVCRIASQSLDGEIHAKKRDYDGAISLLKSAISVEDQLKYQEPPDWFFSVRHNLGAVLIESGKYREAIEVYKQDLVKYPENGWALAGMMDAYNRLGDRVNSDDSRKRFDIAWKHADMKISSSRIL
jgi:tetratricopeptide (TPR) repeat protein